MKFLLTIALGLLCISLTAQQNITAGEPYKEVKTKNGFYFRHKNTVLTVKLIDNTVVLQSIDALNLSLVNTKMYQGFFVRYVFEEVFEFNDRYYLVYSIKEDQVDKLLYSEIDPADLSLKDRDHLLMSCEQKVSENETLLASGRRSPPDKYNFSFSGDSSSLLVQYRIVPKLKSDAKSHDIIGLHFFNSRLEQQWTKQVTMPYTEKKLFNRRYFVDNKGNCFISSLVEDDDAIWEGDRYNYHSEVLRIRPSGEIKAISVEMKGKYVRRVLMREAPDGQMLYGGFYRAGKNNKNDDGILTFNLDEDGKVINLSSHEFPTELLKQYPEKDINRKKGERGEFEDLWMDDILFESDGSVMLVGEQYYEMTKSNSSVIYTMIYLNDILVTKIDSRGSLLWMKKLPKRQAGAVVMRDMSYKMMKGNGCYYFLFVDHKDNMNRPIASVPVEHMAGLGGFLTAYKVMDDNGHFTQITIVDVNNINSIEAHHFVPGRIVPISASSFVFEIFKPRSQDVMIKVDLSAYK